jgi:hypothetical protein
MEASHLRDQEHRHQQSPISYRRHDLSLKAICIREYRAKFVPIHSIICTVLRHPSVVFRDCTCPQAGEKFECRLVISYITQPETSWSSSYGRRNSPVDVSYIVPFARDFGHYLDYCGTARNRYQKLHRTLCETSCQSVSPQTLNFVGSLKSPREWLHAPKTEGVT